MPSAKNTFSKHILNADDDEAVVPERTAPVNVAPSSKPERTPVPNLKPAAIPEPEEPKSRLDYRKTRADKEGKRYINILIDKDLQAELKPRMVTRNLTWESLVEGLLTRWLEENPGFKP